MRAPNERAISTVRSVQPVSTTTISSTSPRTDSRQRERWASSFFTIMQRLSVSISGIVLGSVRRHVEPDRRHRELLRGGADHGFSPHSGANLRLRLYQRM